MAYAELRPDWAEWAPDRRAPVGLDDIGADWPSASAGPLSVSHGSTIQGSTVHGSAIQLSAIQRAAGNGAANRLLRTGGGSAPAGRPTIVQRQPATAGPGLGGQIAAESHVVAESAAAPAEPLSAARRWLVAAAGGAAAGDDDRSKPTGRPAIARAAPTAPTALQRLAGDRQAATDQVSTDQTSADQTSTDQTRTEPADESVELPSSGAGPTSVMVGEGGGGGGGGAADGGVGGGSPTDAPERQAQQIVVDAEQSEQQVRALAASRRVDITGRFGAVRGTIASLVANSSAAVTGFLAARQAEVQGASAQVLASGQGLLAGTVAAAQGQVQQARTTVDTLAQGAVTSVQSQVSQTASRIAGVADGLPLPDLPGVSAVRAGIRSLTARAATTVNSAGDRVRGLIGSAVQAGASLFGSLLSSAGDAARSALSRAGAIVQQALSAVFAGLNRLRTAVLEGLRRALDATVLAGLRRAESTLVGNLATAEGQAVRSIQTNRDEHLQALREGRGTASGGSNLAEEARQNNTQVVETFRERAAGLVGNVLDAVTAGASAVGAHLGQLVSRVVATVQAPLERIVNGLRQVGQLLAGFFGSLLAEIASGVRTVVEAVRTMVQRPLEAVIGFATGAVTRAAQFFAGLPARLLGGNFSLPDATAMIGGPVGSGPIVKPPPPGTIVKPILTFLSLLFLTVGAIVLYFAPSLVAAVAAALVALGITVAPATLLIIVGVVAILALIAALILLYLLYKLLKPGPKKPPPVITHQTDFAAPDGSPNTRTAVAVGERVVFTGSAPGTWTASSGSPTRGSGATFAWVAPVRRRGVTVKLVVGGAAARVKLDIVEPNGIAGHKITDQTPAPGKFGAGMFLDFELQPLRVSFGNVGTREVEGPASGVNGYYTRFSKADLRHNPGPVHFFPLAQNNRFAGGVRDDASWLDQPAPFSDGGFHWVIPNKFRVLTESGDGKQYTKVVQEFLMEASGRATVNKAGAHTRFP